MAKFEVPKDLIDKAYQAFSAAKDGGKIRKGTNETTKAVDRKQALLVAIADDVQPAEVVAHLPIICDEQGAQYAFVPSKQDLGKALGIDVTSAAAAILDAGDAQHIVDQVIESIKKIKGGKPAK